MQLTQLDISFVCEKYVCTLKEKPTHIRLSRSGKYNISF